MIEVSGLTKTFGSRTAIDNLNFKINAGEIVGFLGPNGAGKSTTMKILTGIMPASAGTARVAGFDVFDEALEVKKNVGYLPENPPVYFDMVVSEYLEYAAKLHLVPAKKLKAAVDIALEKAGLTHVRYRLIGNLSKGYRQRVGIAQAIVHDPKVMILDEPTVGLDPLQIIEVRELIQSLAGAHTVILSSHILPEVTATCARIVVINKVLIADLTHVEAQQNFQMLVRNPTPSGLKALSLVTGVKRVTSLLAGDATRIKIELLPESQDLREALLDIGIREQMKVLEFASEKLSLEEMFLRLTTQGNAL